MNITEKLQCIENRVSKLEKKVFEGKQVGDIYHVCTIDSYLNWIKPNNILQASGKYKNWLHNAETDWVSFTRNQLFTVETDDVEAENVLLQIVVDGDLLSNDYKIGPYNDFAWTVDGEKDDTWDSPEERESEEAVKGPIKNISKYIKEIRFDVRRLDFETIELIELTLQNKGIKYFNFIKDKERITKYLLKQSNIKNGMSVEDFLKAVNNPIVYEGMLFSNNIENVKQAVEDYNCDVNKLYGESGYPLHFHCRQQHKDIVEYLLSKGADPNQPNADTFERLPLAIAAGRDNADIARALLKYGAEVDKRDKFGKTPLMWAAKSNSREVAKVLIDNGADVNAVDNNDYTVVQHAPDMRMVRLLYAAGAKK